MDLVLHQVVELEHVDVADGDVLVELFAVPAVPEPDLAGLGEPDLPELLLDLLLGRTVEHGGRGADLGPQLDAALVERPAQVGLEDLADVHAARDAQRVEDDVHGRAVRQEGHVLLGQDLGDHALVAVAAGHLVAHRDLALGRDTHPDEPVDTRQQLVALVAAELTDVHDLAALAVRQAQAGVLHLARLLPEDRAQQALLCGQLGLALGRDLADQDVARLDLRADVHDAVLVEVLERLLAHVGDIPGRSPRGPAWCRGTRARASRYGCS